MPAEPPATAASAPEPTPEPDQPPPFLLELALPVEAAARLARHPAIASLREGRARGSAEEVVWLDSAEGLLADQGLVLERRRRDEPSFLRTLPPDDAPCCPGQPAAADATAPEGWDKITPVPLAAFTGRRSTIQLGGTDPITLDLVQGRLRAVADEEPAARLTLAGGPAAVLALAGRLAIDLSLLPAPALAEAGRALARQEAPRPRRRGIPAVPAGASVEAAVQAVIGHLLEVMLHQAPRCVLGSGPEGVHQLRVALRRLRSALKNFRPAIRCAQADAFDKELGLLARRLGPARDWDVFLGGLGAALAEAAPGDKRCIQLLRAAEARRDAAYGALREALDGAAFRHLVLAGIALVALRPWREAEIPSPLLELPVVEFGSSLLDKRWHKLCEQGEDAESLDAEALHELRLGCKRLRYAAELFAPIWPGRAARRFLRRLAGAQEALGHANDLSVARALVAGLASGGGQGTPAAQPWAVGLAEGFALGRAGGTRVEALNAWEKLRDAKPFWDAG